LYSKLEIGSNPLEEHKPEELIFNDTDNESFVEYDSLMVVYED
jgi:hypothetical protein